jgi:hypothetical protein
MNQDEQFMNYMRAAEHGKPVKRDKNGLYVLAHNPYVEHKQDKSLYEVFGSKQPTSLVPNIGPQQENSTPMEFTPLAQYIEERSQGKNDFGKAYVEAAYSGLMKMKKGGAMLGAAMYDKFLLEDDMKPMVQRVQDFYENNIFNKINEVEGLGPVMVETMTQYMIPYAGARKLFTNLTRNPVVKGLFDKAIKNAKAKKVAKDTVIGSGSIAGMSAVAVSPGDENALKAIIEYTGLPEGEASTLYNRAYEFLTEVEDPSGGVDADAVIREKTRAFFGDLPIEVALTGTIMLISKVIQESKNLTVEQLERLQASAYATAEE